MVKIYHNNRCGKSREALKMLEEKNIQHEIVDYMNTPVTEEELEDVLEKLDMDAIDLVRNKEADWKENFKGKELDEAEIILAMIEYPKLMERPIIVNGKNAVVARPAEKMNEIL
jgi:arsenate reductase